MICHVNVHDELISIALTNKPIHAPTLVFPKEVRETGNFTNRTFTKRTLHAILEAGGDFFLPPSRKFLFTGYYRSFLSIALYLYCA